MNGVFMTSKKSKSEREVISNSFARENNEWYNLSQFPLDRHPLDDVHLSKTNTWIRFFPLKFFSHVNIVDLMSNEEGRLVTAIGCFHKDCCTNTTLRNI